MTTFQSIIYAIIHGLSQFLPISPSAHETLVPYLVGWQAPSAALSGAIALGVTLATLGYFRHDWASMISCSLQVFIYRKRPMTVDERIPFFLAVTTLPIVLAGYTLRTRAEEWNWPLLGVAGLYAAVGAGLWLADSWGRKNKGTYDWNWRDAAVMGLFQLLATLPGGDSLSGLLMGALFLNYRREAAVKYSFFALTPVLVIQTTGFLREVNFHASVPAPDLSWMSFGVAFVVALFAGLLAMGGLMRHVQQKGMGQYVIYRLLLALGTGVVFWFKG